MDRSGRLMQFLGALAIVLASSQNTVCHTTTGPDTQPPAAVLARAGVGVDGFHGNGKIWTYTWDDDTVTFNGKVGFVGRDGSLKMKFFWLLATAGPLTVSGKRLDASAAPLRAEFTPIVGQGFQPSYLIFPTPGCWEVSASANGSTFTFVTRVVKTF
jgi:hypothetical protein